jgi:hypothetical protein
MTATVRVALAVSALSASLAAAPSAHARPTARSAAPVERWSEVRPGVRHLQRREGPFAYHVVTIDLRAQGLSIRATDEATALPSEDRPHAHHWTRTSTWARREGADIAINGNYYDLTRWSSACGLAVSNGQRWASTYDDRRLNCFASAAFGAGGRAEIFDSRGLRKRGALAAWMNVVVSGSPALIRDGEVLSYQHPRHARFRNPRTAIGLSKDGDTLYLLVVEGREGSAQGMTCRESASVLRQLGAWNAINLDGGGSSALFIAAEGGVVNRTGEPERPVVNHLGFFFDEVAPEPAPSLAPPSPAQPVVAASSDSPARPDALVQRAPWRSDAQWTLARIERLDPRRIGRRRAGDWTTVGSFVSFGVASVFGRRRRRRADTSVLLDAT